MSNIMVTGASGFVGRNLCRRLLSDGHHLIALSRSGTDIPGAQNVKVNLDGLSEVPFIEDVDVIIHLAARVPHEKRAARGSADDFDRMNCDVTIALAEQAVRHKVRRFVFLSTTSIFGTESPTGKRFSEDTPARPQDHYSRSKYSAEIALQELNMHSDLEITILRAPIVYGDGAPGKYAQLVKLVESGLPIPFAAIENKRSLIHIENLVDVLTLCATHPKAANRSYVACDPVDLSITDLIRYIAFSQRRTARLLHVPLFALNCLLMLIGKQQVLKNLAASFRVDSTRIRNDLGWIPTIKVPAQNNVQSS